MIKCKICIVFNQKTKKKVNLSLELYFIKHSSDAETGAFRVRFSKIICSTTNLASCQQSAPQNHFVLNS